VLSRQLRQLERRLGISLFQREGRRLRLTRAAEELLPRARDLLGRATELERMVGSLADGRLDELHLAVPTTTLTDVLAPFLATLGPADPVAKVRELDPRGAVAAIRAGADLAIVTRHPGPSLSSHAIATLPVWAYVRADDPWAARSVVEVAELVTRPLVLLTEDLRPRPLLDAAVEASAAAYGEVLEVSNAQVAQALAASGRGVAVVSDDPRFDLVPLHIKGASGRVRIRLYAAWDPHHHASASLAALAERLSAFCVEQYGTDVAAPSPAVT
jgi:DNA-binding transcriptional LysR family regulator